MVDIQDVQGFLLEKAVRDLSKLVKVRRMVTRKGKTFPQDFWVNPKEVKKTDVVLQNSQNLLPAMGSVPKPAAGILDMAYFKMLDANDKQKAVYYVRSLGFALPAPTGKLGIDFMHAKAAINKFVKAHPTFANSAGDVSQLLNAQKQTSNSTTQVFTQPQGQTTKIGQNTAAKTQNSSVVSLNISSFTSQQQAQINGCANGKEKWGVIRGILGNQGAIDWAKTNGLTWNENAHAGINLMRCGEAVKLAFDAMDGTTSDSPAVKVKPDKKAINTPPAPKVDPDELVPDAKATEREKKLIEHINKMTVISDIKMCADMGMVPEDDVSKDFIIGKLHPKYVKWVTVGDAPSAVKTAWNKGTNLNGAKSSDKYYNSNEYGFSERLVDKLKLSGYGKSEAAQAIGDSLSESNFSMGHLSKPCEVFKYPNIYPDTVLPTQAINPVRIIQRLNEEFAQYTTDEYKYQSFGNSVVIYHQTNLGYTGDNPQEYQKRYNKDNEGFVRYVKKIAASDPTNAALQARCNEIIDTFDESMRICNGNSKLMFRLMNMDSWQERGTSSLNSDYHPRQFGSWSFLSDTTRADELAKCVSVMEEQYNTVISELQKRGFNQDQIVKALGRTWYNSDLSDFKIRDDNDVEQSIDFSQMLPSDRNMWNSNALRYTLQRYKKQQGILNPTDDTDMLDYVEYCKQAQGVTNQQFTTLKKNINKIAGIKFQENGTDIDVDFSDSNFLENHNIQIAPSAANSEEAEVNNQVASNLILGSVISKINNNMCYFASHNRNTATNKNGTDYSGNYDYYSGGVMSYVINQGHVRVKQRGNNAYDTDGGYTTQEIADKVDSQLANSPVLSRQQLKKLSEHYASNSKNPFKDKMGMKDYSDQNDSPTKDIQYMIAKNICTYIPKMREYKNLDKKITTNLEYEPYDFSLQVQPKFGEKKTPQSTAAPVAKSDLLKAKEELLKKAHCSVSTEDEATSLQMRKDFMKNWDYRPGEKTPDGHIMTGRVHSGPNNYNGDQRALFNSRFFKVNNSTWKERFDKEKERMIANGASDRATQELEVFHGTSYASTGGIIGRDGKFFMGNIDYSTSGKMLGIGAYVANKGGKSSVYVGNGSYANRSSTLDKNSVDAADGCMILLTAMRGENDKVSGKDVQWSAHRDTNTSKDKAMTCLAADAGSLNDWEAAIKRNELLLPHHFVDLSCRCTDVAHRNVDRDSQGNYTDRVSGNKYDKYGALIGMK